MGAIMVDMIHSMLLMTWYGQHGRLTAEPGDPGGRDPQPQLRSPQCRVGLCRRKAWCHPHLATPWPMGELLLANHGSLQPNNEPWIFNGLETPNLGKSITQSLLRCHSTINPSIVLCHCCWRWRQHNAIKSDQASIWRIFPTPLPILALSVLLLQVSLSTYVSVPTYSLYTVSVYLCIKMCVLAYKI